MTELAIKEYIAEIIEASEDQAIRGGTRVSIEHMQKSLEKEHWGALDRECRYLWPSEYMIPENSRAHREMVLRELNRPHVVLCYCEDMRLGDSKTFVDSDFAGWRGDSPSYLGR